jgi:hypothetical protein
MKRVFRVFLMIVFSPLILSALVLGLIGLLLASLILFVFGLPIALIIWALALIGVRTPTPL